MKAINLLVLLALLNCNLAYAKIVRIGTARFDPPYSVNDNRTIMYGFDIDLMKTVCKRQKWNCQFIGMKKLKLFDALRRNKIDLAIGGIEVTPKRKANFQFSQPYFLSKGGFVILPTSKVKTVADLSAKKVGALNNLVYLGFLKQQFSGVFKIKGYKTPADLVLALKKKKIDAAFINYYTAEYLQKQHTNVIKSMDKQYTIGEGIAVMALPKNRDLIEAFNRQLKIIQDDGTYVKIYHYNLQFINKD